MTTPASSSSAHAGMFVPLPRAVPVPPVKLTFRLGGPCYEGHQLKPDAPCPCLPDIMRTDTRTLADGFPRVAKFIVPASITHPDAIAAFVVDAFPVERTCDTCRFEDEYAVMLHDALRATPVHVISKSPDPCQGSSSAAPPCPKNIVCRFAMDVRRNGPLLQSEHTIVENLNKIYDCDYVAARRDLLIPRGEHMRLDEAAVLEAFNQCKDMLIPAIQLCDIKPSMPYPVEYNVTQYGAARLGVNVDGCECTMLEAVADLLHKKQIGNVKLVGNMLDCAMGPDLVASGDDLWPADRFLTRVVVYVGDPSIPHDYCGREMKSPLDRALNNYLVPVLKPEIDYDGSDCDELEESDRGADGGHQRAPEIDAATFIDSLADLVSTLYNAFLFASAAERAEFREKRSWIFQKMQLLAAHPDEAIAGVFSSLLYAFYHIADDENIAQAYASLYLTFILAGACDIAKFRSSSRRLLKVLLAHNHSVNALQQLGICTVSASRLPFTGGMPEDYLQEIVEELNTALSNPVETIPVPKIFQ